jgi:hypothetical protein
MSKHILLLVNNAILKDKSFKGLFVNGEGLLANKILARTHQNLTDERSGQHRHWIVSSLSSGASQFNHVWFSVLWSDIRNRQGWMMSPRVLAVMHSQKNY